MQSLLKTPCPGWKTTYHTNGHQNKAGVAILISDQLDCKPKLIIRDEEGHYIMLKGSVQQEDLTILNTYAPNMGAADCINQLITKSKKHINNNTIVGDFNTPLNEMDRSSKQKINSGHTGTDGHHRYIQNISSQSNRIHILL